LTVGFIVISLFLPLIEIIKNVGKVGGLRMAEVEVGRATEEIFPEFPQWHPAGSVITR
jgi:hypothetical protein